MSNLQLHLITESEYALFFLFINLTFKNIKENIYKKMKDYHLEVIV